MIIAVVFWTTPCYGYFGIIIYEPIIWILCYTFILIAFFTDPLIKKHLKNKNIVHMLTNDKKMRIIILYEFYLSGGGCMVNYYEETEFVKEYFKHYDDTFTWYVPDDILSHSLAEELINEVGNNQHLHIHKYLTTLTVLAKHKERNDVLFLLPNKECALVHLSYGTKQTEKDDLHFVFFNNCEASLKYITKQYKTECLGEKGFVLSAKDKIEIMIFLIQLILFFIVSSGKRGIPMVCIGIILYVMILLDWRSSGFNLFRDKKLYHSKVIPLLRYQIAYILVITALSAIGIAVMILSSLIL